MKDHAVIILRDGDKLLFVQRAATKKSLPNIWAFPSGTIEAGEAKEVTIIREAQEELGIKVKVEKVLASVELPELNAHLHFFVCSTETPGAITFDPSEIQAIRWLTLEEFFREYDDTQIGHGLIYLRSHPEIKI